MNSRNGKRMMGAACRYAYSRFVLNYDMYYETMAEEANAPKPDLLEAEREVIEQTREFQDEFLHLVGRFLKGENPIDELENLRRRFLQNTNQIMLYLGQFSTYEYVLERIKGRFFPTKLVDVDDQEFVLSLLQKIASKEESGEQNLLIKNILSELPMRFTKAKYFSLLRQALSVYEGTDKVSLEQELEQIRQDGILTCSEDAPAGFQHLHQILFQLGQADYQHLDKQRFQQLWDDFVRAKTILLSRVSDDQDMMDLINDFYVICLTCQDTLMDIQEKELFHTIISSIWEHLDREDFSLSEEEMTALLVQTEGRQEAYYEQWSRFEFADLHTILGSEKNKEDYGVLWKISRLLSTSSFMSLEMEDKEGEKGKILLSRTAVEEMCQSLFDDLENSWKGKSKYVVRSVMAKLFGVLPMFFSGIDDLRQFILGCLDSCTDMVEKSVSIQAIQGLMEMNDDLV